VNQQFSGIACQIDCRAEVSVSEYDANATLKLWASKAREICPSSIAQEWRRRTGFEAGSFSVCE